MHVYCDKQIQVDIDKIVSCVIQSKLASVGGQSDLHVVSC